MSSPRVRRSMVSTPALSSCVWKSRIVSASDRSKRVPGNGLNGIRLTLQVGKLAHELDQLARMLGLVVDALHQGVFERDRGARLARDPALAGRHQLGDRIALVERHQLGAQLVVGRVQRHRQRHVDGFGQLVDQRHHAGGGQRDALGRPGRSPGRRASGSSPG